MDIPARFLRVRPVGLPALAVALSALLLGACTAGPRTFEPLGEGSRSKPFSQGRITVLLVDEYGIVMPGMRVNLSWQEPYFYKTSAFTNRYGEVSFSGVPEVAEVSVDHPGGHYVQTLIVPQTGRPEFRAVVDTQGGAELLRQRERARLGY